MSEPAEPDEARPTRRKMIKWTTALAGAAAVSILAGNEIDELLSPKTASAPPTTSSSTSSTTSSTTVSPSTQEEKRSFSIARSALLGDWSADVQYSPSSWLPGQTVSLNVTLGISHQLWFSMLTASAPAAKLGVLVTAERDFDPSGLQRFPHNYQVSTILTPTGLPIEGGGSSAISPRVGHPNKTPVDAWAEFPFYSLTQSQSQAGWYTLTFPFSINLPSDLPPGHYRLRFDFGYLSGKSWLSLNGDGLGQRPSNQSTFSFACSPSIAASGKSVNGDSIDASRLQRRCYWILLSDYNSNGYRGVVAEEDKKNVAISPRNLIQDDVILPMLDSKGNRLSYNIEPAFLNDSVDPQRGIPWDYGAGQWSVKVIAPDGSTTDLGTAKFVAQRGYGATTKDQRFIAWKPPVYGKYTIQASGWINDVWGNTYYGGGSYTFWIAKRLTLATATFQGQSYAVGNRYGRDIAFFPPVPADVSIDARLYYNSDPNNFKKVVSTGTATAGGIFSASEGLTPLPFDGPGEYFAHLTATYWDPQGNLWVEAMTHAGVVYPASSSIVAHGKMLSAQGKLVARGEQQLEGYIPPDGTLTHLDHINFPYDAYDVLLIASEQQGANKIEPVLTYATSGSTAPYDTNLQSIGRTNVRITTSNNFSPEMFPEYITNLAYFYAAAPRPGFMSRFLVAHDGTVGPYWPTSRTSFGGQFGTSNNGDQPGDIYRLIGGVVLRPQNSIPSYAGYQASVLVIPGHSNNNRVVAPGQEDLYGPDARPARFFLVPVRPGTVYQLGMSFTPVLQIDPVLPCDVTYTLTAPDGTRKVAAGQGDQYGYFAGTEKWSLNQPGVWTYLVKAKWNDHSGIVPGLPDTGGSIFVVDGQNLKPDGIVLSLPEEQSFSPTDGMTIMGKTPADKVYYTVIMPGAVLEEGVIPVANGQFSYKFDPKSMATKIRTYDIKNLSTGNPEIGRIVHLTFFCQVNETSGTYQSFAKVILRGTTSIYVRGAVHSTKF